MRENHYAVLVIFENFSGFQLQDKHNASYIPKCRGYGLHQSDGKFTKFIWNIGHYAENKVRGVVKAPPT